MNAVKRKKSSVAIDTVPLPEKVLGMKTKKAKLVKMRERYYVMLGKRRVELPVGSFIQKKDIVRMVGKEISAVLSLRKPSEIVAIGTWPTPEYPRRLKDFIVCYIPAPDVLRRIDDDIRLAIVNKMVREKLITNKLGKMIKETM